VPLTTATSPMRTWFSRIMKKPLMTSRTRFWAPKPTARPTTPALARMGATATPSSLSTISSAITQMTMTMAWRSSRTRVSARLAASPAISPCWRPLAIRSLFQALQSHLGGVDGNPGQYQDQQDTQGGKDQVTPFHLGDIFFDEFRLLECSLRLVGARKFRAIHYHDIHRASPRKLAILPMGSISW
jgi:hypothetical protein